MDINNLSGRSKVPEYEKLKPKPDASHLVQHKKELLYKYYICDYCGAEIKILEKRQEMTGGITILPNSLTRRGNVKMALCNKCLNSVLKELENKNKEV